MNVVKIASGVSNSKYEAALECLYVGAYHVDVDVRKPFNSPQRTDLEPTYKYTEEVPIP